ncbi:MAG TPA: hypothetical protein VEY71_12665, partial [Chitinophagales bacterium]|nr:hypothetical protein [Chitinophagales bacterium]
DEAGMTSAAEKSLNAHNQYLQNWLANGALSLLLLIGWIVYGCWKSWLRGHWLALGFFGLAAFNFLFESMLERREGLFAFAFFSSVFLGGFVQEKSSSPNPSSTRSEGPFV